MRLIDADALMETLGITDMDCGKCKWGKYGECKRGADFKDACCAIEDAPTVDAEPVVRCKDCKNYGTDENRLNCIVFCCTMPKNGFCSMGERKDGKRMDCNR